MLFNSIEFPIFFAIVYGLYWLWRKNIRAQNALILLASYVFYGWWDYRFLFLIILSTAIDFVCGLMIGRGTISAPQRGRTSIFLLASALLFVTFRWDALSIRWTGSEFLTTFDWQRFLPSDLEGWGALLGVLFLVVAGNALYPVFTGMDDVKRRKLFVFMSVFSNLAILGFFKYYNFFVDSFADMLHGVFGYEVNQWTLSIVLPVGISFYTFQTMSYTIDVYRKELKPSGSLLEFAAYVAFFPQLVAGPIERGKHLLPQFTRSRSITREDAREGIWLIAWGFYKKIFVADNLAGLVDRTFIAYDTMQLVETPMDGLRIWVAVYAFAFQIYADFSGYTDIARGTARLMGFDIMLNFNLPYISTSPSEFWRRWHISLSSWLRDYLYIPLGGNKKGTVRTYFNLMMTMLLGGLWHGAAWNFVLWGAYQGGLLVVYRFFGWRTEQKQYPWWQTFLQWFVMFHLICIGWLIFRAQSLTTIWTFLEAMFLNPQWSGQATADFQRLLFYTWFLIGFQAIQAFTGNLSPVNRWHWFLRLNVYLYIIMSILTFLPNTQKSFIYFAF